MTLDCRAIRSRHMEADIVLRFFFLSAAFCAALATAGSDYTGYSGAPGSRGSCAATCHGSSGGTVTAVGFPDSYAPGSAYLVSIVRRGGSTISNFNASVRIGTGSVTAGTITAGYRTSTYSRAEEPNGVHLSSGNRDSCTFTWTAPESSVGEVKLYLAALQGSSMNGPNTTLVLTSSPASGIGGRVQAVRRPVFLLLSPTVVSSRGTVRITIGTDEPALVRVADNTGRLVARISVPSSVSGRQHVSWKARDQAGNRLAPGTYQVVVHSDGARLTRKLVVR